MIKFKSGVSSNATVGNTNTEVLSARSDRLYAVFSNDSDETMYLSIGTDAVMNKGHRLNANGGSLTLSGDELSSGAIYAICSSGGKNMAIFEAYTQ